MKQNKASRPVNIGLLGANAVVPCTQVNAQWLQKLGGVVRVKIPVMT